MQLIRQLPVSSDAPTSVAIGNFDGQHLGHQAVLCAMLHAAKANGFIPSVLTFEPHPRRFFAPQSPAFRLERLSTKLERLAAAGVERVYMPRFNAGFSGLLAKEFLEEILRKRLGVKAVVTGENFAFGRDRGGDIATLRAWGTAQGVEIIAVPPVRFGEAICSSSAIRAELAMGDVVAASHLLGRRYSLEGRVVHGDGRGATIGFPTANISLPPTLKLPAYGVYAVLAEIEGVRYQGVANLGVKPTVAVNNQPTLEVHLFDVAQDLYGKKAMVTFVSHLRPEQKFSGLDALVAQITVDCATARKQLSEI